MFLNGLFLYIGRGIVIFFVIFFLADKKINGEKFSVGFQPRIEIVVFEKSGDLAKLLCHLLSILKWHRVQFVVPVKLAGIVLLDKRIDELPRMKVTDGQLSVIKPVGVGIHDGRTYGRKMKAKLFMITVSHPDLVLFFSHGSLLITV